MFFLFLKQDDLELSYINSTRPFSVLELSDAVSTAPEATFFSASFP